MTCLTLNILQRYDGRTWNKYSKNVRPSKKNIENCSCTCRPFLARRFIQNCLFLFLFLSDKNCLLDFVFIFVCFCPIIWLLSLVLVTNASIMSYSKLLVKLFYSIWHTVAGKVWYPAGNRTQDYFDCETYHLTLRPKLLVLFLTTI